jgi:NAD(P)-dependent dehydrogenase (short-subunit alcohol dehydrogenase family)
MTGRIRFDDLQGEHDYGGPRAYSQSKLANVLFTYELARRLEGSGVTANCVHPGAVRTNFGADATGLFALVTRATRPLQRTPVAGADTVVWAASAPEREQASGEYLVRRRPRRSSRRSYDRELARRLWQVSEQLTGIAGNSQDVAV